MLQGVKPFLPNYASYLIRLWREPAAPAHEGDWQLEIEHIQSGTRLRMDGLEALGVFLQNQHPPGENHAPPVEDS